VESDGDPAVEQPLDSSLPSVGARVLAFLAILLGGACGGIIGFAVADVQCTGDCTTSNGIAAFVGALLGAAGVAVVAVLALRAMGEWRSIQDREAAKSVDTTYRRNVSRRKPSA
jgi:hypothetical protein